METAARVIDYVIVGIVLLGIVAVFAWLAWSEYKNRKCIEEDEERITRWLERLKKKGEK